MNMNSTRILLTLGVVALISACDRPKPQAEVDRNVAEERSEVAKDMVEAKHEAINEMTEARNDAVEEIQEADRDTTRAQSDLQKATADANYKLALEQASGERDIAVKKCEAMASDLQKVLQGSRERGLRCGGSAGGRNQGSECAVAVVIR